jgi:hypothetical protein
MWPQFEAWALSGVFANELIHPGGNLYAKGVVDVSLGLLPQAATPGFTTQTPLNRNAVPQVVPRANLPSMAVAFRNHVVVLKKIGCRLG